LLHALSEGEHMHEGYGSKRSDFMKWVEDRYGFKATKTYQLMTVYDRLTNLGITEADVRSISYRKLYAIVAHATSANVNDLLAAARSLNDKDLPEFLRNQFVATGSQESEDESFDDSIRNIQNVKFEKFTFRISQDECEILQSAIEKFTIDNPDVDVPDNNPLRTPLMGILMSYLQDENALDMLSGNPETVRRHLEALNPSLSWQYTDRSAEQYVHEASQQALLDADYA
jgi:hypothetical protein